MALLDVILGYDCNLACDYCTITPAMRRRSLTTAHVLAAMRRGRARAYDAISFTGGEPTIRPDLTGLVRAAQKLGFSDIKVQSNGLLFAHPPNVDRLIAAGCNRFHISIHTHDPSAYDALVRRHDSYRLMVAGLDNLLSRQVKLTVDVLLKTDTYPKLGAAMRWLCDRGVTSVHLWFVSLTDENRDNLASMPKMTEVVPALREAFAFGRAHGMDVRSLHVPRCLLARPEDIAHAWDPGADRVMVVTPEATFELRDSKLAGQTYVPACDGCEHRAICPGIRADYLERFGDAEIAAARAQEPQIAPTRTLSVVG